MNNVFLIAMTKNQRPLSKSKQDNLAFCIADAEKKETVRQNDNVLSVRIFEVFKICVSFLINIFTHEPFLCLLLSGNQ